MTLFEDNLSPYLTVVEQGSTPASPSAGDQKLFVRSSDHLLCYVNSSGTVTPVSASSGLLTTKGDLFGFSTVSARVPVGTNGQVLTADSTQTLGLKWATPGGLASGGSYQDSGANYSITGTSFADVDATNLGPTLTTGAHHVKVTLMCDFNLASTNVLGLDFTVDGTRQGDATNGLATFRPNSNGASFITFVGISAAALTAASHVIRLQAKVDGGTATLYRSGLPMTFIVEELSF